MRVINSLLKRFAPFSHYSPVRWRKPFMKYVGVNDPLEAFIVWYLEFRGRSDMAARPRDTQFRGAVPFSGDRFSSDHFSADRSNPVRAVDFLISAVTSKIAAANMTNFTVAQQIIAAADETIETFLDCDDICPPWPYPGPPPWLTVIAAELTFVANSLQEGSLQTGILQLAEQVMDRAQALSMGMPCSDMKHAHAA
jgi:hypothetical protein